jgi:TetR/AcrR family transcriptional regulator
MKRSKRRRGARRVGRTEQRILDAAHVVFVRRGTAGARMQEIAAEAGVNQALLHYYFRTKEQLAQAAFARAAAEFMPAVIAVMAGPGELEDKVARIVALELDHLSRAPYLPGYIISEVTHRPDRARQLIAAMAGQRPEDIRPRIFAPLKAQLAARPMLMAMLGIDDRQFSSFITERRVELPSFFLGALRP